MNNEKILAEVNEHKVYIKVDNIMEHWILKNKEELLDIILSLGVDKLIEIQETKDEVIIIDKEGNFAIILAGNGQEVEVIDIVDNVDIFINDGINIKEI